MEERSRIALLSRAGAIVFGDRQGARGETGWGQGAYFSADHTVCLNAALFVAEREVFAYSEEEVEEYNGGYGSGMHTKEGAETQLLLAQTIAEMYPEVIGIAPERITSGSVAHHIIVEFNDGMATAEAIQDVLWKCEQKALDKWLEDHPTVMTDDATSQAFVDFVGAE